MYDNANALDINTAATNVPANDAQFDFSVSANVSEQLATLIGHRKDWDLLNVEQNARSDKRLHQILSTIYNMGWTIANNAHPDQNIQGKFDAYCNAHHIKFHKDTSYFVRICGVVFGRAESNSYSAYGKALKVALANNVPMGGLIEFLADVGGINGTRQLMNTTKGNSSAVTLADKASEAVDHVAEKNIARITDPEVCKLVEKGPKNGMAVLLVTLEDDGTLTVHSVSQADSIVNRVVLQAKKEAPTSAANSEEVPADVAA